MAVSVELERAAPARVLARVETEIFASRHLVWNIHTYVNAWSRWQPDVAYAVIEQLPAPGVPFRWYTHERAIASTIDVFDEASRIRWCSVADDLSGVHDWTLTETLTGVRVASTACLHGPAIDADPAGARQLLERSHAFWLRSLKKIAESR